MGPFRRCGPRVDGWHGVGSGSFQKQVARLRTGQPGAGCQPCQPLSTSFGSQWLATAWAWATGSKPMPGRLPGELVSGGGEDVFGFVAREFVAGAEGFGEAVDGIQLGADHAMPNLESSCTACDGSALLGTATISRPGFSAT